jgi:tripartite-type tricarboxylate transporter receptor subunit TctC
MHAAIAGLVAAACANGAGAQVYPSKPVRLIVPYAAGGGVDILGRIVAAKLTESLGVQVIVDNRAGGGTIIGSEAVAKAPAEAIRCSSPTRRSRRVPRSTKSCRSIR